MSAYTDAVDAGLADMHGVSSGACPGCLECAKEFGLKLTDDEGNDLPEASVLAEFHAAWASGRTCDEGSFSWCACGVCRTRLGGERYVWHWIKPGKNGSLLGSEGSTIVHERNLCGDCVLYLANGDEPETWK